MANVVGSSVERVEDARLLTGRGRFTDDVRLPGTLHAAFLRSIVPHARIRRIDVERARTLPGVSAVFTAADFEGVVQPLDFSAGIPGHTLPTFGPLSGDKARYVGDPLAVVVATSRYVAEDALGLIDVEFEELPHVLTVEDALAVGAPVLFEELGDNLVYDALHEYGDVEAAFAAADRVVTATIAQHRFTSSALETRGAVASYDPESGELLYHSSNKSPHMLRVRLSEHLGLPQHRIRVVTKDVGGAFGGKGAIWREDLAVAAASLLLGRPVKWIEDRSENLTAFGGAREEDLDLEAAVDADGVILGLRVRMRMNHGAYPGMWLTPMFAALVRSTILSALRVRAMSFATTIAATNKNTYISYRGPGASETLARERLLDAVAAELGLDAVEIRRRNLLTRAEQPRVQPNGVTVHRAHARETLEAAVELAGYDELRREQERARAEARLVGIGVATSIQPCPGFPDWWRAVGYRTEPEPARVRLEPDGRLTVVTSEMPTGQGHETTLAQVAADCLGVPFGDVHVVFGDTQTTPFYYFGSGASRASNMGAGAVLRATGTLKRRILELAAHLLEVRADDLELADGAVRARGAPSRQVTLEELARRAYREPDAFPPGAAAGLDALEYYEPEEGSGGWAASTHVCVVEVDGETGVVGIRRYVVVEDCGPLINPAVVAGQIRGGIAQGLGGALLEHAAYDEDGQFLAGTFMTYLLPTALEVPEVEIHHLEIPTDDPVPFRGVGESGAIMAPAVLSAAIEDALRPFGVRVDRLPLTPTRILELIGAIPVESPG